jgi:hypothetical protein
LLNASASADLAGSSFIDRRRCTIGDPPTNGHTYASKLPRSLCTRTNAAALLTVDSIFPRWRTTLLAGSSLARIRPIRLGLNRATAAGSNSANSRR